MSDRITVAGRLGKDPERRATKAGETWLTFRLASTPRVRDEQGDWGDGDTSWYSVNAYGALARNAADSLHHGERVVVTGDITVRSWTGSDGRTVLTPTIRATAIGHDLTFGTTSLARSARRPEPSGEPGAVAQQDAAQPPVDRSGQWAAPMSGEAPAEHAAPHDAVPGDAVPDDAVADDYLPDEEPAWATAG